MDCFKLGFEPNPRSSSESFGKCSEGITKLECNGTQNESHLSHPKFI